MPCGRLALAMALLAAPAPAAAFDTAVNVGAIEIVSLPERQHIGAYPYLAVSLAFPLRRVTLIPSLGMEASPELARFGVVASFTADFPVRGPFGLDLVATLIHDQAGSAVAAALFFFGVGVGASWTHGHFTLSPSLNAFTGLNTPGFSLVPALNLAYTL